MAREVHLMPTMSINTIDIVAYRRVLAPGLVLFNVSADGNQSFRQAIKEN
jgi:hypothetical protein